MGRIDSVNLDMTIDMNMEVFNFGPVVIVKWKNEPGWPVEYVSGNAGVNFGYSATDLVSDTFSYESIVHPLDLSRLEKEIQEHIEKNLTHIKHNPFRIITSNGDLAWVSVKTIIQKNENDEAVSFLSYIIDITDQIEKENKLLEIKERYDSLLNITKEGVWEWDLKTDKVFYSKRWKEIMGIEDHEIDGTVLEWEKRVHKDDLGKCYSDLKAHLEGKTEIYENTHRALHVDGTYHWILDRGVKICDAYGKPCRMIGTYKDITKEKEMREKIAKIEEDSTVILPGENEFNEIIHHKMAESKRYKTPLILIMVEIDSFKKLKETLGNAFGKLLSKKLSEILKGFLRTSDYAFILDKNKFSIVVTQTEFKMAFMVADRLREAIANTAIFTEKGETHWITVSIGITEYMTSDSVATLIKNADLALNEAKEQGQNRVCEFRPE